MNALPLPLIPEETTLRETISVIDRAGKGIALVVRPDQHLLGTITDGDVRRAVLSGTDLESPIRELLHRKHASPYPTPITARRGTPPSVLLETMEARGIRHIPILDEGGSVVGLVTLDELIPKRDLPLEVMLMAGGLGTRLRPLTEAVPKPMLPVGGRPLLEITIARLRDLGLRKIHIATHYRAEKITDHFGNGEAFGVELTYLKEDLPLGTAGAIALMGPPRGPLLVLNGDILTQVDIRDMLVHHRKQGAQMSVGVRRVDLDVPYGVVECQDGAVLSIREKPRVRFFINAGIYLLEPAVQGLLPTGRPMDMPELVSRTIAEGLKVVSFPVVEYWLDIGSLGDYEKAQNDLSGHGEGHRGLEG